MPLDDGRDIVLVSDFHMSAGYDPRRGVFHRNEDFFYDNAFARFVAALIARGKEERRSWRLVLLGDFVDFLQVGLSDEPGAGATSREATVDRLGIIGRGHPRVFTALASFLAAGHAVAIVSGNHDVELVWPEAQAALRQLVVDAGQDAGHAVDVAAQITFHPWIFYVPGVVYAEHGHQYDETNSFATLIAPFLPRQPELIELPLGSFFVRYLFNSIERIDPFADNVKPPTRYVGWALRNRPVQGLATTVRYAQMVHRVLRKVDDSTSAQQKRRREAYRQRVVRGAADQIGLPAETLIAIDSLANVSPLSARMLLRILVARPLAPVAAAGVAGVGLFQVTQSLPRIVRYVVLAMALLAGQGWRERQVLRPATEPNDYLLTAARRIDELLRRAGAAVPAYVFGHTHTAVQFGLGVDEDSPRYLNTGTWTPIVSDSFNLLSSRELFTYVQVSTDARNGQRIVQLLLWNDDAGRAELLPLLDWVETHGEKVLGTVRRQVSESLSQ